MRSLAAPLALGLVLAGCSFDEVRRRAAHDLACAESKIETTQLDESRLRATGCGRSATYFCGVDARGFDSCTREKPNPRKEVQATASVDLACPPAKIAIDDVKDGFVASGCGRTATYACREVVDGHRCSAVTAPVAAPSKTPPSPPR